MVTAAWAAVAAFSGIAYFRVTTRFLKSMPPMSMPIGGIITSATNDETICPNAAPITIPTAISTTLPLTANALNSCSHFIAISFQFFYYFNAWLAKNLAGDADCYFAIDGVDFVGDIAPSGPGLA